MVKILNPSKNIYIIAIPFLIFAFLFLITELPEFKANTKYLSIGITVDLLLTTPLFYVLLIRKTKIPTTTVIPVLIIGLVLGSIILPSENQHYLNLFKRWALPLIELSILAYVIFKIKKAIKRYSSAKTGSVDFFTALKETCNEILPKQLVIPAATEIAVFYYGLLYWKKRKLKKNEFSYHKNSGTVALLVAFIFLIAIETTVFHILLSKWSALFANILSLLSIYTALQVLGFLKSMIKRPISIEKNKLLLRYGIMSETTIEPNEIKSIEVSTGDIDFNEETRKLSIFGDLEPHNIIIQLNQENTLIGLYGRKRQYRNLAIYVDNKEEFKNRLIALKSY